MNVLCDLTRRDQGIEAGQRDAAATWHAPESGSTVDGGEKRQRGTDSHLCED